MNGKICVGVFDGDKSNRMLIRALSRRISSNIIKEAADGLTALDVIEENQIDICFINLRLPVIDAVNVALSLKNENYESLIVGLNSDFFNKSNIVNLSNFNSCIDITHPSFSESISNEIIQYIFKLN